VVTAIGGRNRYYALDFLWTLRELADWFVGGPGSIAAAANYSELRVGDTVDSWQVIGLEPERRLTMLFGMKAPGAGVLEFELKPEGRVHPGHGDGLLAPERRLGLLYWYPLAPFHGDFRAHDGRDRAPRRRPGKTPQTKLIPLERGRGNPSR
jgi:hypothetical protein